MWKNLAMALAGVTVLASGAVAAMLWPRGSDPVSLDEAVVGFQETTTSAEAPARSAPEPSAAPPAPGVYTFDASGTEEVKLGALPAEYRPYPETVPVTIVAADEGCFTVTVNLLEQHTEDTTYCTGDDGSLQLDDHTKHQQVGAMSPTAAMSCSQATLYDPDGTGELGCELALAVGPTSISADLDGTSEASNDRVDVDGETVDALRLDISYAISGDLTGEWTESLWLRERDRLPVRIERHLALKGLATFTENSELQLTSTESAS